MKKIALYITAFSLFTTASLAQAPKSADIPADVEKLLTKYACLAFHKVDSKVIGPAYTEVAKKKYTSEQIVALMYDPKPANWPGYPPMTPMKHVPKDDALQIASWITSLGTKKEVVRIKKINLF